MPRSRPRVQSAHLAFDPDRARSSVLSPEAIAFGEARGLFEPGGGRIHDPVVYYMRMDRLVKIGTTTHLLSRIANIMPQGVMAIEYGNRDLERQRHQQFADTHSHGEWYWMNEPLAAHIAEARARFEAEEGRSVETWLAGLTRKLTKD